MQKPVIVLGFQGTSPCARSNGGCQQLCFHLGSGRRTCSCAHGRLAEDGFACERYEGYLLYSERTILKSIHLSDENDLNSPVRPFENPAFFKNVIALAFDYSQTTAGTNRIFYSDAHFGNIQTVNDDWTGRAIIAESKCISHFYSAFFVIYMMEWSFKSPTYYTLHFDFLVCATLLGPWWQCFLVQYRIHVIIM